MREKGVQVSGRRHMGLWFERGQTGEWNLGVLTIEMTLRACVWIRFPKGACVARREERAKA